MKTLKTISAALLIAFTTTAFAAGTENPGKLNMSYTVTKYIDALSHGKITGISEVLDSQVKFTITGGSKTLNYNKAQILTSLQSLKNIQQNCITSYSIVESNSAQALVKVTMKYDGFSRVNFLNMANTVEGWKITNVSSSFI